MNINHRHFVLILVSIITLIVVCTAYFFIYKQTIVQADHYASANFEISNEDGLRQKEADLKKVYDDTKTERDNLKLFFINEDKAVVFIEMVEKVGIDTNTKIEMGSISNTADVLKANVKVDGSWMGVMTALGLIENLPVSSVIYDLKINSSGELTKTSRLWTLTFSIEVLTNK
jgi:hypothetical protein